MTMANLKHIKSAFAWILLSGMLMLAGCATAMSTRHQLEQNPRVADLIKLTVCETLAFAIPVIDIADAPHFSAMSEKSKNEIKKSRALYISYGCDEILTATGEK